MESSDSVRLGKIKNPNLLGLCAPGVAQMTGSWQLRLTAMADGLAGAGGLPGAGWLLSVPVLGGRTDEGLAMDAGAGVAPDVVPADGPFPLEHAVMAMQRTRTILMPH